MDGPWSRLDMDMSGGAMAPCRLPCFSIKMGSVCCAMAPCRLRHSLHGGRENCILLRRFAAHNCMPLHKTSFSSSRSYRSNSSSAAADAPSHHHRHETATNGLLAIFNSPSKSFHYSQRSLDDIADPIAMPSGLQERVHARRGRSFTSEAFSHSSRSPHLKPFRIAQTFQRTVEAYSKVTLLVQEF